MPFPRHYRTFGVGNCGQAPSMLTRKETHVRSSFARDWAPVVLTWLGPGARNGRTSARRDAAPTWSASTTTTGASAAARSPPRAMPARGWRTTSPPSAAGATACAASCWTSTRRMPTSARRARSGRCSSSTCTSTRIPATPVASRPRHTSATSHSWGCTCSTSRVLAARGAHGPRGPTRWHSARCRRCASTGRGRRPPGASRCCAKASPRQRESKPGGCSRRRSAGPPPRTS